MASSDLGLLFHFNNPATTESYPLSLHDALPICAGGDGTVDRQRGNTTSAGRARRARPDGARPLESRRCHGHGSAGFQAARSEEHTSELQSRLHLVCRLLLEKKNNRNNKLPPSVS